jgi:hypothetical protein
MADEKITPLNSAGAAYLAGRAVESVPPLKSGGGDGTSGGMLEARVGRLEDDMKEVKVDLKALRVDVAEMKGKISALPTTWQIAIWFFGANAALLACAASLAKFMKP